MSINTLLIKTEVNLIDADNVSKTVDLLLSAVSNKSQVKLKVEGQTILADIDFLYKALKVLNNKLEND